MVVFGHIGYIPAKLFFSGKVVVIGQSGCNRAKWLCSVKSGCIRKNWLYSGEVILFGEKLCSSKLVVFGQKWLYSGKWL